MCIISLSISSKKLFYDDIKIYIIKIIEIINVDGNILSAFKLEFQRNLKFIFEHKFKYDSIYLLA